MTNQKFYLVRSPHQLIKERYAGYGWKPVNFSEAKDEKDLFRLFSEKNINVGRSRNQIKRFYSIKKDDILIIPLHKAIAIGYATGEKSYGTGIAYGHNRVGVNYLTNEDGSILRIPRNDLLQGLESRLKIRMSVVSLDKFKDEILKLIADAKNEGVGVLNSKFLEADEKATEELKTTLLANIRSGKTYLESGGRGLEKLVVELLNAEGYIADIEPKNKYQGIADSDIFAVKGNVLKTKLQVQVKHHDGITGKHALKQIEAIDEEPDVQKWIITSANFSSNTRQEAETQGINIIEGEGLVEWIIEHVNSLSTATLNKLGISKIPRVIL